MTKEEEIMHFLYENVFDPILASNTAPQKIKSGVNLTIGRMNRLTAEKMRQYFWSALVTENAAAFASQLEAEGLPRFEDITEKFKAKFTDKWLKL